MPLQIYSRRLWYIKNGAGNTALYNPGPNLYVVRTVTVWYGALSANFWSLQDENTVDMLVNTSDGLTYDFQVWNDLRLVWPAGATWNVHSDFGADSTGHGYELSPP
jgi:hypothetical protein